MTARPSAFQTRPRHPIGSPGPMRPHVEAEYKRQLLDLHIRDHIRTRIKIVGHHLYRLPWYGVKHWWRLADWVAIPTILVAVVLVTGLPWPLMLPALAWPVYYAWLRHHPTRQVPPPLAARHTRRLIAHDQRYLNKHVQARLKITGRQALPHVIRTTAQIPPGIPPEQVARLQSMLSGAYRQRITLEFPHPGQVVVSRHIHDVLAEPCAWEQADPDPYKIPIGLDADGRWITAALPGSAWLTAGIRGSGKSAFLNGIIARCTQFEFCELYLIDPVDGVDLGGWHKFAVETAESADAGIVLLHELEELRKDRVRTMRRLGVQRVEPSERFPMQVLVIDELADLFDHDNPDQAKKARWLLRSLTAKGRKSQNVVLAATQDIRADIIPPRIRAQFTSTLGLRMRTPEQTNVTFGPGTLGTGVDLSSISAEHQGRGWWDDGNSLREIRSCGLWGRDLTLITQAPTVQKPLRGVSEAADGPSSLDTAHTPGTAQNGSRGSLNGESGATPPETKPPRSVMEVRAAVVEVFLAEHPHPVKRSQLVAKLHESTSRIGTALDGLRRDQLVELRSKDLWYWAGEK